MFATPLWQGQTDAQSVPECADLVLRAWRPGAQSVEQIADWQLEAWQDVGEVDGVTCPQRADLAGRTHNVHRLLSRVDQHRHGHPVLDQLSTALQLLGERLSKRDDFDGKVWRRLEVGWQIAVLILWDTIPAVHDEVWDVGILTEEQPRFRKRPSKILRERDQEDALDEPTLDR